MQRIPIKYTFDEAYRWLLTNIGRWSCNPDPSFWIREGEKVFPRCQFTAFGTSYLGRTFEEALQLAMDDHPLCVEQ